MERSNLTTSAIISFAEKLEGESSRFYRRLAEKSAKDHRETFLSFAKESEKNSVLVTRTYRETITDALEACFSFKGLDLNDYTVKTTLTGETGYPDALKMAIRLEETASRFYFDVAECSKSLLATIPSALRKVAMKRESRMFRLKSMIQE